MRTEQEMFNLILNIAEKDERIRAVILNGSRTKLFLTFNEILKLIENKNSKV